MAWWTRHWEDIRPQLKYDAMKACIGTPAIALGYWLIQRVRHMPFDWYIAGAFTVFFLAFLFVSARQRKAIQQPTAAIQVIDGPVAASVKATEDTYNLARGAFLDELEAHFQMLAVSYKDPKEREKFLVKALSVGAIYYLHDITWFSIFKSQLDALNELNSNGATVVDALRRFYDSAAATNTEFYKDYPLDAWIGYMKGQLLIRQDGNILQITVRGKDFLKYIVLRGFAVGRKSN